MSKERCGNCGQEMAIGSWPYCPHGELRERKPFPAFWDEHISPNGPVYIDSLGKWNQEIKRNKVLLRDCPRPGNLSARIDRCMQIRKERERAS